MADVTVKDFTAWKKQAHELMVDMANEIERLKEENKELRRKIEIFRRPTGSYDAAIKL